MDEELTDFLAKQWTAPSAPAPSAAPRDTSAAQDEWPVPRPLAEGAPPPPFPLEGAFPTDLKDIRDFVAAVAEQLQVPLDLPAMMLLSMGSLCIAQKFEIEPRTGWREVAAIWVLILLPSGERKSGTFSVMTRPIMDWETAEAVRLKPEIARNAELRRIAEAKLTVQRKIAAKAKPPDVVEATELAVKMAQELDEMQVIKAPVIYTSDATTESLAGMLAENLERGMVASPEGDALDVMMGRYSGGI